MSLRVLVVDDDDNARRAIAATLGHSGFDVATASDAAPALRIAEVATPDVVIVDSSMASGGLGVVRSLKQKHGSAIYVVVLTGEDAAITREICSNAGGDSVLFKPISQNELGRVLTDAAIALAATTAA